jgi:glycosyltransferase involved in cell wall biosynthesis
VKIIYFYQYFTTPKGSYGTRVYEFTKRWVEKGHDVTVVTSVYAKSDIRATRFIDNQIYDGINVKIINVSVDNKQPTLKRIWAFIQYMATSCWFALTLKADVVVSSSGPITVGLPGLVAHYLRGRKFVFEVRDLWPEVAVELGILHNKTIIKFSYWFEKRCYKAASQIITLSPGMEADIKSRFGFSNITTVTNAANLNLFGDRNEKSDTGDLKPMSYAIYNGNIGVVNNSYWLYYAAKILNAKGRSDIKIVLVGDGQQKEELARKAKEEGVGNFILPGLMPKNVLVAYIQNALVSLVPLKGTRILDTSSPNKFFESMAAGIPVIQNTRGWIHDYLTENNVGFTLDPDNPDALAGLLIELEGDKEKVREMGARAKTLAARDFDKNILADRMLSALISTQKSKIS